MKATAKKISKQPRTPWPETTKRARKISEKSGLKMGKVYDIAIRKLETEYAHSEPAIPQ